MELYSIYISWKLIYILIWTHSWFSSWYIFKLTNLIIFTVFTFMYTFNNFAIWVAMLIFFLFLTVNFCLFVSVNHLYGKLYLPVSNKPKHLQTHRPIQSILLFMKHLQVSQTKKNNGQKFLIASAAADEKQLCLYLTSSLLICLQIFTNTVFKYSQENCNWKVNSSCSSWL